MQNAIQSNSLIGVPILDDAILATRDEQGRVLVVIKRICEKFGLDFSSQLQKLKNCSWATVVFFTTVAEDGKQRELAMIDLDSLPAWLFSINPKRMRPDLRDALIYYQKKAKDVLAAYFFGKPMETAPVVKQEPISPGAAIIQIGEAMLAQERRIATVETVVEEVKDRLDDAEAERIEIRARVETIEESQPIYPTISRSRKRQRVYDLLKVPSLAEFSNGRIARMLDVSAQFVGQVRCELERLGIISTAPVRKTVNDRHISIANLGRKLMTNGVV